VVAASEGWGYRGLLEQAQEEIESRGRVLIAADRGGKSTGISEDQQAVHMADDTNQRPPGRMLRVGVCCEMGRHRSVAFVEELSRQKWPREWAVQVVHRDVDKRRQRKEKASRKEQGRDE